MMAYQMFCFPEIKLESEHIRTKGTLSFKIRLLNGGLDSLFNGWNSGISIVDLDGDGWKDIRVRRALLIRITYY